MRSNGFQMNFGHFVGGLFPPGHTLRGMIRIARIARGIVISHFHLHPRPLRQEYRQLVPVLLLPVEVPFVDVDERQGAAVRQIG